MNIVWAYDREHLQHPFIGIGIETLRDAGHEVTVVAADKAEHADYPSRDAFHFRERSRHWDAFSERRAQLKAREKSASGMRVAWLKACRFGLTRVAQWRRDTIDTWRAYARGYRALRRLEPDVVVASRPEAALIAWAAMRGRRIRFVYYPFELYGDQTGSASSFIAWAEKKLLKERADALITQNECRAQVYAAERGFAGKPAIVHNYKPVRAHARSGRLRQALGLGQDTKIALYEGMLIPGRWLQELAKSASFLPENAVIVLMGKEKSSWLQKNAALLDGIAKASGRLRVLPPVPHSEILDYAADADAGIIIYDDSCRNNLYCEPGKLSDYLAACVPVVAPAFPTIQPVVEAYGIGECFHGHSPQAIAAAISAVLAKPKAEWQAALRRACDHLTWETQAPAFLEAVTGESTAPALRSAA